MGLQSYTCFYVIQRKSIIKERSEETEEGNRRTWEKEGDKKFICVVHLTNSSNWILKTLNL